MHINSNDSLLLGIFEKKTKKHIGNVKLDLSNSRHSRVELGLFIGEKELWGNGYGAEAVNLTTEFAHKKLDIYKVTAGSYQSNRSSINLFLKCGYHIEASLRDHWVSNLKKDNQVVFAHFE